MNNERFQCADSPFLGQRGVLIESTWVVWSGGAERPSIGFGLLEEGTRVQKCLAMDVSMIFPQAMTCPCPFGARAESMASTGVTIVHD